MKSTGEGIASEAMAYARFLAGLPAFLRRPMPYDAALAVVQARLRNREANFLAALEQGVYRNPASPYRVMLQLAGCELGDLRRGIQEDGLEPTLRRLHEAGVHVTFEEFKGAIPIVRGGREIPAPPSAFDNPSSRRYYQVTTGGSTGAGRRVLMDLPSMAARLPMRVVTQQLEGGRGVPEIWWADIPPSYGLSAALSAAACGEPPPAWYTAVWKGQDSTGRRFRWATVGAISVARLAGARVAWPRYLPLQEAGVIARHAGRLLQTHGRCRIRGGVSRMLRVAIAARQEGIDLSGVTFFGGGEPPTEGKVAQIQATGARFRSGYHFMEAGTVGLSCATSTAPNDQHFMRDHLAVIQIPREVPGFDLRVPALCFTTLLGSATKLLLNVESDDYGQVETRACDCPLGAMGFTDHISEIRSYRKLTGEGVTLVGSAIEKILWEVLPERHGGSALDYQLLEEEDDLGLTRLTLLVNPSVAMVDEDAAVGTLLQALRNMGATVGNTVTLWNQAATLRLRREAPRWTARGKLMPLELGRRADSVARRTQ